MVRVAQICSVCKQKDLEFYEVGDGRELCGSCLVGENGRLRKALELYVADHGDTILTKIERGDYKW